MCVVTTLNFTAQGVAAFVISSAVDGGCMTTPLTNHWVSEICSIFKTKAVLR